MRQILAQENRQKRRGWWSAPSLTAMEAAERRGLTPAEWDALGWRDKTEIIAYYRATDTMRAWEQHVMAKEMEREAKKRGR